VKKPGLMPGFFIYERFPPQRLKSSIPLKNARRAMNPKTDGKQNASPMTRRLMLPAIVFGLLLSQVALAGGNGDAAVGGGLGGVLGNVVGGQVGGSTGAAIGAGVGGAAGSAVAAPKNNRTEAAVGGGLGAAGGSVLGNSLGGSTGSAIGAGLGGAAGGAIGNDLGDGSGHSHSGGGHKHSNKHHKKHH
jgi:hypothetical protein